MSLSLLPLPHGKSVVFQSTIPNLVRTGTILHEDSIWCAILSAYSRAMYKLDPEEKIVFCEKVKSCLLDGDKTNRISTVYDYIDIKDRDKINDILLQELIDKNRDVYNLLPEILPLSKLMEGNNIKNVEDFTSCLSTLEIWEEVQEDERKEYILDKFKELVNLIYYVDLDSKLIMQLLACYLSRNIYIIDENTNMIYCYIDPQYKISIIILCITLGRNTTNTKLQYEIIGTNIPIPIESLVVDEEVVQKKVEIRREFEDGDEIIKHLKLLL